MFMQGFGHPRSNAADIELVDKQNRLIFSTIVNGAFYNRLKKRPFAITPIDGSVYDLRQKPVFQKHFNF